MGEWARKEQEVTSPLIVSCSYQESRAALTPIPFHQVQTFQPFTSVPRDFPSLIQFCNKTIMQPLCCISRKIRFARKVSSLLRQSQRRRKRSQLRKASFRCLKTTPKPMYYPNRSARRLLAWGAGNWRDVLTGVGRGTLWPKLNRYARVRPAKTRQKLPLGLSRRWGCNLGPSVPQFWARARQYVRLFTDWSEKQGALPF